MRSLTGKIRRRGDVGARGRIVAAAIVILACTFALACAVIQQAHEDYHRARHNAAQMQDYLLLLDAGTRIAIERGPANMTMAARPSPAGALARHLSEVRAHTDEALARLEPDEAGRAGIVPAAYLADIRRQLTTARALVDATAAIPDKSTISAPMQAAIQAMMEAADSADDAIQWKARALIAADEDLAGPASTGVILSHLRDQAGRIASFFMPAIASRNAIPIPNLIESRLARGKTLELWRLVELKTASFTDYPEVARKRDVFAREFFGNGLGLIDEIIRESTEKKPYTTDVESFSQQYVLSIKPLEELRATLLSATIEDFDIKARQAARMLMLAWVTSATILALVLACGVIVQVHILRPLSQASYALVAMSEDRFDMPARTGRQSRELRILSQAMTRLMQMTKERAALLARLNTEATTDGLTGLLNRATLDLYGQQACAEGTPSLILLDIDHFKTVNDTYGHPVGDAVIIETARRLRRMVRAGDRVGRFGGEEFAILVDGGPAEALALARRLRLGLSRSAVVVGQGIEIPVTASFGVSDGGSAGWSDLVARADSALYQAKNEGRNRVRRIGADPLPLMQCEGIAA